MNDLFQFIGVTCIILILIELLLILILSLFILRLYILNKIEDIKENKKYYENKNME